MNPANEASITQRHHDFLAVCPSGVPVPQHRLGRDTGVLQALQHPGDSTAAPPHWIASPLPDQEHQAESLPNPFWFPLVTTQGLNAAKKYTLQFGVTHLEINLPTPHSSYKLSQMWCLECINPNAVIWSKKLAGMAKRRDQPGGYAMLIGAWCIKQALVRSVQPLHWASHSGQVTPWDLPEPHRKAREQRSCQYGQVWPRSTPWCQQPAAGPNTKAWRLATRGRLQATSAGAGSSMSSSKTPASTPQ